MKPANVNHLIIKRRSHNGHLVPMKRESGFSLQERNENDTKNHVAQQ